MVSAYDELPRTPANFVALSPLRYLERATIFIRIKMPLSTVLVILAGARPTNVAVSSHISCNNLVLVKMILFQPYCRTFLQ